jgi:hypothetical protein
MIYLIFYGYWISKYNINKIKFGNITILISIFEEFIFDEFNLISK